MHCKGKKPPARTSPEQQWLLVSNSKCLACLCALALAEESSTPQLQQCICLEGLSPGAKPFLQTHLHDKASGKRSSQQESLGSGKATSVQEVQALKHCISRSFSLTASLSTHRRVSSWPFACRVRALSFSTGFAPSFLQPPSLGGVGRGKEPTAAMPRTAKTGVLCAAFYVGLEKLLLLFQSVLCLQLQCNLCMLDSCP